MTTKRNAGSTAPKTAPAPTKVRGPAVDLTDPNLTATSFPTGGPGAFHADGRAYTWAEYAELGNMVPPEIAQQLVHDGVWTTAQATENNNRVSAANPTPPTTGTAPGDPAAFPPVGGPGGSVNAGDGYSSGWKPTGGTDAQKNAYDTVHAVLAQVGLDSLAPWAWDEIINGATSDQVAIDLRARPEYKDRFPGMAALQQAGMSISEAQYISREANLTSIASQFGLPTGWLDRGELGKIIGSQKSDSEFQQLMQDEHDMFSDQVPAETKAYALQHFGVDQGGMFAAWLDGTKALPLIDQQKQAAQIGGAFTRSGLAQFAGADLGTDEAMRLASLGISQEQAAQGYTQAYQNRELTQTLPGVDQSAVSLDTLTQATVQGTGPAVVAAQREKERRAAAFGGGGSFAASGAGAGGLGTAAN